jgi:hypothetical protein
LGCGKGEGSPNPPPKQSGARPHGSGNCHNKFLLCLFGNGVRSCLKTAAIALSLTRIFILISFQVLAPLRRGSLFLPNRSGALASGAHHFASGHPAGSLASLPPSGHAAAALAASKGRLIRCTVLGSTPNRLAMTRTPGLPGVARGLTDSFFERGGNWGASEAFTFTPGPRKTGTDSFRNHRALEFEQWGFDEHRAACRTKREHRLRRIITEARFCGSPLR